MIFILDLRQFDPQKIKQILFKINKIKKISPK